MNVVILILRALGWATIWGLISANIWTILLDLDTTGSVMSGTTAAAWALIFTAQGAVEKKREGRS